jgi:hypothetical protein
VRSYKPYFVLDETGHLGLFDAHGRSLPIAATLRAEPGSPHFRSHLLDLFRFVAATSWAEAPASENFAGVDPRYQLFAQQPDRGFEIFRKRSDMSWSPQKGVGRLSAYLHEEFELNTYQWQLLEGILGLFRQETDRDGAALAIMLLPVPIRAADLHTVTGGDFERRLQTPDGPITLRAAEPRDRLRQISERLGIRFFDPTADFIETAGRDDLARAIWPTRDKHFSDGGHAIIADLTYQWLAANGFAR